MITIPTVLILGAGASRPFGFPTGKELRRNICKGILDEGTLSNHLQQAGFMRKDLIEFAKHFWNSQAISIDSFLEHNSDFAEIGKCAIHLEIQKASLRKEIDEPDWYELLWQALASGATAETFSENKLSVVTFNYDVSLETFLGSAIASTYRNCGEARIRELHQNAIPIQHVYGRVELRHGEAIGQAVREKAKEIRIIHDATEQKDPGLQRARKLISDAQRVCILGFGFHGTNLSRIGLLRGSGMNLLLGRCVYATCFDYTDAELWDLRKRVYGPQLFVGYPTWGNRTLIRQFGAFLPDVFIPDDMYLLHKRP